MKVYPLHPWDVTPKEAVQIQRKLVNQLISAPLEKKVTYVAGADISFNRKDPRLFAAVVVLKLPELEVVETRHQIGEATFPYVPGLLSFRELPLLCKIFEQLKILPDVIVCDGQGIAHPRGIGLAAHLGLLLNVPTIGCAKTLLVGEHRAVGEKQWSRSSLIYREKVVGAAFRTREKVKPVFISPGHLIDLKGALAVIKRCTGRYRIPEPTRQAHILVNQLRRYSLI